MSTAQLEGGLEDAGESGGHRAGGDGVASTCDDDELVAGQSADGVTGAQRRDESVGDHAQQFVAQGRPECVVELPKSVDVDQQDAEVVVRAVVVELGCDECQDFFTTGKPGQRIVPGDGDMTGRRVVLSAHSSPSWPDSHNGY